MIPACCAPRAAASPASSSRTRPARCAASRAGLVVGADGLRSIVARLAGARDRPRRAATRAASSTATGEGLAVDGYHWHYVPGASAGVIPTNDGATLRLRRGPRRRFLDEIRWDLAAGHQRRDRAGLARARRGALPRAQAREPARLPGRARRTCARPGARAGRSSATPATSRTRSPPTASPTRCATPSSLARAIAAGHRGRARRLPGPARRAVDPALRRLGRRRRLRLDARSGPDAPPRALHGDEAGGRRAARARCSRARSGARRRLTAGSKGDRT